MALEDSHIATLTTDKARGGVWITCPCGWHQRLSDDSTPNDVLGVLAVHLERVRSEAFD